MNAYEIYKRVEDLVSKKYFFLGFNKKREITRLIFEILKNKKEFNISFLPDFKNYNQFKKELLKIRYPVSVKEYPSASFYLPLLKLNKKDFFKEKGNKNICEIVVEKKYYKNSILDKLKEKFPYAKITFIESFKKIKKNFDIESYNIRSSKIYIVEEKYDILKPCPCTKNCIGCGYYVLNLGFGCPMECEYCYLQNYQNFDGIILNPNIDDYLELLRNKFRDLKMKIRIGSGEFTDSLYYDDITEYSLSISKVIKDLKNVYFEFKTKTLNTDNFFKIEPCENIIISYSLNPQEIIEKTEHFTSSMDDRIKNLKKLTEYGYYVGIHFDPVIKFDDWENLYYSCIKKLFDNVYWEKIKWISIGSFRFSPETKKIIEKRFPDNLILNEEMVLDFDGKLRYPYSVRKKLYKKIIEFIINHKYPLKRIYLCMEEKKIWDELNLNKELRWD